MLDKQLQIEREAYDYSYDRMVKEVSKRIEANEAHDLAEGQLILRFTIEKVASKIQEYLTDKNLQGKVVTATREYLAYYYNSPKDLAFITISSIVQTISKEPYVPVTQVAKKINKAISDDCIIKELNNKKPTLSAYVDRVYAKRNRKFRVKQKQRIGREFKEKSDNELDAGKLQAASILLDCVLKSGTDIIEQVVLYKRTKKLSVIKYTDRCFKMIIQSRETLLMSYKKYPIFVHPPKNWESLMDSGGYYTKELYKLPLIKTKGFRNRKIISKYIDENPDKVSLLFSIINRLQQTKWRINRNIHKVISSVFFENMVDYNSPRNNPYLIGKLPYNESQEPSDYVDVTKFGELVTDARGIKVPKDKKQYSAYIRALETQQDIINSNYGKAIGVRLALLDAETYINYSELYFSYQYDFRSRIYPIQQHLHPQGNEVMKALLEFADGCRIENDEQEYWFLIHGANCYGYDKEEYDDRVTKIKEKHQEILEIASDPIRNRGLWKDCDSPYLYLAWCFEYADYVKFGRDNFISHLPIGLDATCSGIQIYSGLLLDEEGAIAVNVIGKTRSDIYQKVADKVNNYLLTGDYPKTLVYTTADKKSHTVSTDSLANELAGKITRSITKRNTMTQPYSVTKFGMYQQLKEVLDELESTGSKFWTHDNWLVAKLLTELNDRAIVEVVKGARIGQEFLKEVTADLVKENRYVFYTTPFIGFPVLQKIHKTKEERITTEVGQLTLRQDTEEIHQIKMVNGIAPNFIHSLDAVLLQLTFLGLYEDGCRSFHFIHDQYGVPINYIPQLNTRVREAFVELFRSKPLEQWLAKVYRDYPKDCEDVMVNTLNLEEVLESKYIFS